MDPERRWLAQLLPVELGLSNLNITKRLRSPKAQRLGLVLDLQMPQSQWMLSSTSDCLGMGGSFLLVTLCRSWGPASLVAHLRAEAGDHGSVGAGTACCHPPACHQQRKPMYSNLGDSSDSLQHRSETHCWSIAPIGKLRPDEQSKAGCPATLAKAQGTLPGKKWQSLKRGYVESCPGLSFRFPALETGLC